MKLLVLIIITWINTLSATTPGCIQGSRSGAQKTCLPGSVNSIADLDKLDLSSDYPALSIPVLNIETLDRVFFEKLSHIASDLYVTRSTVLRVNIPSIVGGPRIVWINEAPRLAELDFEDKDNEQLEEIIIESSAIRELPVSVGRLKALVYFGVKNSYLKQLNFDLFAQLLNLQVLNFEGNRITLVESTHDGSILVGNIIDLGRNQMVHLEMDVFKPMRNLIQLKLDHNNLTTITTNEQLNLRGLVDLSISHNQLKELDVSMWNTPHLDFLNLHKNALVAIHPSLTKLSTISSLDLGSNKLQRVDLELFSKMSQLIMLRLDDNQIVEVKAERSLSLPQLAVLKLANNKLANLDVKNWQFPLKTLDVSANRLNLIEHFPDQLPLLKTVNLLSNPWKCSWLEATVHTLLLGNVDVNHLSAEDLLCPHTVEGLDPGFRMCCEG